MSRIIKLWALYNKELTIIAAPWIKHESSHLAEFLDLQSQRYSFSLMNCFGMMIFIRLSLYIVIQNTYNVYIWLKTVYIFSHYLSIYVLYVYICTHTQKQCLKGLLILFCHAVVSVKLQQWSLLMLLLSGETTTNSDLALSTCMHLGTDSSRLLFVGSYTSFWGMQLLISFICTSICHISSYFLWFWKEVQTVKRFSSIKYTWTKWLSSPLCFFYCAGQLTLSF